MSTLICFALKQEAAPFHPVASRHPGTFTLIVGIGRENAERSVRNFLHACTPKLVLTCGFAGGLNPELKPGAVVFQIGKRTAKIEYLEARLLATGTRPAIFFCADRIATTVAEKTALRERTGADAVEMESAAIHAVCAEKNIPCVTVRVISDTADEDLPLDFNALGKPDKNLDAGKLAWAIAKAPWKIPALLALGRKTDFAARQLAGVLEKIISA
jgi:adenosylhomocysteine nucleosidase